MEVQVNIDKQILNIVSQEELDELSMSYKLRLLKDPNTNINLTKHLKPIGKKRADRIIALCGGAEQVHRYLAKTIDLETDNIQRLLQETIDAQRVDLPNMTANERNKLLEVLIKVMEPIPTTNPIQINIDSYLDRDIIDV